MPKELTAEQINQQDLVDNSIYECVNSILPSKIRTLCLNKVNPDEYHNIEWDINWIAEIRKSILKQVMRYWNIPSEQWDEMEMELYPYLESDEEN